MIISHFNKHPNIKGSCEETWIIRIGKVSNRNNFCNAENFGFTNITSKLLKKYSSVMKSIQSAVDMLD